MERHKLVVIIPALNEENSVLSVIKKVIKYAEVILVNDGSTDNTAYLARQAGATVVDHQLNLGYDASLNTGFKKASDLNFEYAITLDADGQHDPFFIKSFITQFKKGADVVIGVRKEKQRFSEIIFSWFTNLKWGIEDPLSGFKGYKLSLFSKLGYFDKHQLIGTELMLFAAHKKYSISQINIDVKKRIGNPKFGSKLISNFKILKALILAIFIF